MWGALIKQVHGTGVVREAWNEVACICVIVSGSEGVCFCVCDFLGVFVCFLGVNGAGDDGCVEYLYLSVCGCE